MRYNERQRHTLLTLHTLFKIMVNHFDLIKNLTNKKLYERYYDESEISGVDHIMYLFFLVATEPFTKGVITPYKHFLFILEEIDLSGNNLYDCLRANIKVSRKATHCCEAYKVYESEYIKQLYIIDNKKAKKEKKTNLKLISNTLDDMENSGKSEKEMRHFLDVVEEEIVKSYSELDLHLERTESNLNHKRPTLTVIKGGRSDD